MVQKFIVVLIVVLWSNIVFCDSELQDSNYFELFNPFLQSAKVVTDNEGLSPTEGQFPWIVVIEVVLKDDYSIKEATCIGATISVKYVLTQARYLTRSSNRIYRLSFGSTSNTNTSSVIQYSNKVKVHPNFDPNNTKDNNIALIKCPMALSFSLTISSISLNTDLTEFFWEEVFFVTISPTGSKYIYENLNLVLTNFTPFFF